MDLGGCKVEERERVEPREEGLLPTPPPALLPLLILLVMVLEGRVW